MNKINELNIQIKTLEEINDKQKRGEISAVKAIKYREVIRNKLFDILDTEDFILGK